MILPIVAYGHPVLRKVSQDIEPDYPDLNKLIGDMWETMYSSNGVGLAAPQVNKDIRLFVVDSEQIFRNMEPDEKKEYPDDSGIKQVFINAHIKEINGEKWAYNEGCLSIPEFREPVTRARKVTIRAQDVNGKWFEKTGEDLLARAFLHETDHLNGKLYISHISALKRDLMKRKIRKLMKAGEW